MPSSAADALREFREAERRNRPAVASRAAAEAGKAYALLREKEQEDRERARRIGEMRRARREAVEFARGPDGAWSLDASAGGTAR